MSHLFGKKETLWVIGKGKVKVKLSLCCYLTEHHVMKAYWESGGIAPHILWPQHLMEVSGQLCATAALPPAKRAPSTHRIEGWMGPRVMPDVVVEDPRTLIVQPIA